MAVNSPWLPQEPQAAPERIAVDLEEAGAACGVCSRTIRNWLREGLRSSLIGRRRLILVDDLREFIPSRRAN